MTYSFGRLKKPEVDFLQQVFSGILTKSMIINRLRSVD